jgi:DNA (cytosine-5)-methyltransferase 1
MNYLSVCSGIEAATVAWHHMGWNPIGFSEIEKFPSQLLNHHYPTVTNYGDMTKFKEWNINDTVGLLVGGTPCQSFSVAGLRKGLEDSRGNLMLTYLGIADHFKPKWILWENVPGVLSSNGGKDFASLLQGMAELGYGFAYRIFDAQHFGVPQRRRRVFVVGCLGDWRSAAKVLFESESLCGDITPSRGEKQKVTNVIAPSVANCLQTTCNDYSKADGFNMITHVYETHPADSRVKEMGDVCQTVTSRWGTGGGNVPIALAENTIGRQPQNGGNGNGYTEGGPMYTLNATGVHGIAYGFEPGIAKREGNPSRFSEEMSPTLRAGMGDNQTAVAYSFDSLASNSMKSKNPNSGCRKVEISKTLDTSSPCPSKNQGGIGIVSPTLRAQMDDNQVATISNMAVRRLTPIECERLQGFPDSYTDIKPKGKPTPDGHRYKALGNSMAVPVMKWIGERINKQERGEL